MVRDRIESRRREIQIYDNAIAEIETNFGSVLYSANVFEGGDHLQ